MNPVRILRQLANVTQVELADAASTSQPTIAAYEAHRKSPTLDTVTRLAQAVGLEAVVEFYPPLTREERRSLALHRAIAERLVQDPQGVLKQARVVLNRMLKRHVGAHRLLQEWSVILNRPLPALLALLTDREPWARELRHVTPFAGVLTASERAEVYRAFATIEARQ